MEYGFKPLLSDCQPDIHSVVNGFCSMLVQPKANWTKSNM